MKTLFNFPRTKTLLWLIASLFVLLVAGCGGSGGGGAASGTLGVFLTDAPPAVSTR